MASLADRSDQGETTRLFEQAAQKKSLRAWDCLFLAMAEHQMGHDPEARRWLARAVGWIESTERAATEGLGRPWDWYEEVETRRLRDEATTVLGTKRGD